MMNRLCQSAFYCPAMPKALRQGVLGHFVFFCPSDKRLRFPLKRQQTIIATVASLLGPCGPSHVARFIVFFVVNAVNRMLGGRAEPHILKKHGKRLAPAAAHRNSASSISAVGLSGNAITANKHLAPRPIFRRSIHAVGGGSGDAILVAKTPATPRIAVWQGSRGHYFCDTTVALANPLGASSTVRPSIPKCNQTPEPLARQVFRTGRKNDRITVSHVPSPSIVRNVVRATGRFTPFGCLHFTIVA